MASTIAYNVGSEWTSVSAGAGDYLLQMQSPTPALVYVGDTAPDENSAYIILQNGAEKSFSVSGMNSGIYIKSGVGFGSETRVAVAFLGA